MISIALVLIAMGVIAIVFHTFFVKYSYHVLTNTSNMKFTVVQLSDIHGRTRFINGTISKLVNKIQPHYVVITGDLATKKKHLARVLEELKKIKCRHIYFVPGNYEREGIKLFSKYLYTHEEYESISQALQEQGIEVLANAGITMDLGSAKMYIYGFDNSIYGNERVFVSNETLNKKDFVILLSHSPTIINLIEEKQIDYDLLLTGHTHGGQIRLLGRTIGAYKNCHVGLKSTTDRKSFYINRGLGTVKIPVRIACSPEIAVFQIGE